MKRVKKAVVVADLRPEYHREDLGRGARAVLKGDAMVAVSKLKQELGGNILVAGSRTLVNALKRHDLIDEYRLMVFPIVLGSGMRLFDETAEATTLKLVDTHPLENRAVILTYRPARSVVGG